jgi:hypothetical protein
MDGVLALSFALLAVVMQVMSTVHELAAVTSAMHAYKSLLFCDSTTVLLMLTVSYLVSNVKLAGGKGGSK